jgi:predicted phage gp36 major capsid-like protein
MSLRRQYAEMKRRCEALEVELRRCREAAHHREEALRRANVSIMVATQNINYIASKQVSWWQRKVLEKKIQ